MSRTDPLPLPKKPAAVFHHPIGFELFDSLRMDMHAMKYAESCIAAEREAVAEMVGEFAKKWWSIHCASNKHMETTRKAHDDFCALQSAILVRSNLNSTTPRSP